MTEPKDIADLVRRERLSRDLSTETGDVAVQRAHRDMADDYAARIIAANKP